MRYQKIEEKRIITGIFKDLERSRGILICENLEHPISITFEAREINGKQENFVRLESLVELDSEMSVTFWLESDYFRTSFSRYLNNLYFLPSFIESIERRSQERIRAKDLSDNPVVIVVNLIGKKLFGLLLDLNQDYLKAEIETDQLDSLVIGEKGEASLYLNSMVIGELKISICDTKKNNRKKTFNLVMSVDLAADDPRPERKNPRGLKVDNIAINLFWPNHDGFSILLNVGELSGFGLSGTLPGAGSDIFPIGSIFQEFATGAKLKLAWRVGNKLGFDFDFSTPSDRERIFKQIINFNKKGLEVSSRKKSVLTLSVLTRAGLLKGDRALSFSSKAKEVLLHYRTSYSQRWFIPIHKDNFSTSFVKISDFGWMGQEIASTGAKGSAEDLVKGAAEEFCKSLIDRINPSSSILCVIDSASKFNQMLWKDSMPRYLGHDLPFYPVSLGSLSFLYHKDHSPKGENIDGWKILEASHENWSINFNQFNFNDFNLLLSFGLGKYEFGAPLLEETLLQSQIPLKRKVFWILKNDRPNAIILLIGLPPLSSSTSLVDNVYVFPDTESSEDLLKYLVEVFKCDFFGIEDIFLVENMNGVNGKNLETIAKGFKSRCFEVSALPVTSYVRKVVDV